jgi:hypothetical protein
MPDDLIVKTSEIARELSFVTRGTLVVTDSNDVLIKLVTGEGTATSVVGEVSFLLGAAHLLTALWGSAVTVAASSMQLC